MDYYTDFLCTPEGLIYSIRRHGAERHVAEIHALNDGEPLLNKDDAEQIVTQLNMRKEMAEQSKANNENWIIKNAKLTYEIKKIKSTRKAGK